MTKVLTPQEALRALADGKTLERQNGFYTLYLSRTGRLVSSRDGGEAVEPGYLGHWSIAEPKNPHPVGTFDWAEWEHGQGRTVQRPNRPPYAQLKNWKFSELTFTAADFRATDWEAVP